MIFATICIVLCMIFIAFLGGMIVGAWIFSFESPEQEPCKSCEYTEGSPWCIEHCPHDIENENRDCMDGMKYTLGSRWWFGDDRGKMRTVFPCHVEEISKSCTQGEQILIVPDDKDGEFKYLSIRQTRDYFKNRLFHTAKEALKGEKDGEA